MKRLSEHPPLWAARYVGLPFVEHGRDRDGVDCWGLVRIVYAERFGVYLPSHHDGYTDTKDSEGVGGLLVSERDESGNWRGADGERMAGDIALFQISGDLWHVGIVVAAGRMLHAQAGTRSCIERMDSPIWKPRRRGFYRYCGPVRIAGRVAPLQAARFEALVPEGGNVLDLLTAAAVPISPFLRVFLGDAEIPRDRWQHVRPKAGRLLTVAAIPAGGGDGGKTALRLVASIAVIAAAAYGGAALGPVLAGAGAAKEVIAVYSAVATAALGIAGTLAVNALIPPPQPRLSEGESTQSPSIAGGRNAFRPFEPFPVVGGEFRVAPMFAAVPYTEIEGDDQYLRMACVWGYGPLQIDDLKIGDTPLDEFVGVEYEIRQGYDDDEPLRIYPGTVKEQQFSVLLEQVNGWTTRTSDTDAEELSVDFTWPQGLVKISGSGAKEERSCSVEVEYAPAGTGAWRQINDQAPDFTRGMDFMFRKSRWGSGRNNGPADGRGAVSGQIAWGSTWPDPKPDFLPASTFAYEVYGYLFCPAVGTYEFAVDGSDSIELFVDDRLVVSWYGTHEADGAFGAHTGSKHILSSGYRPGAGWHAFRLRMESRSPNGGALAVAWKKPGDGAFSTIPQENFMSFGGTVGNLSYRWFDTSQYGSTLTLTESRTDTIRRSLAWPVTPGQYDVRVRRSSLDSNSDRILDKVYFTALRTITSDDPVNIPGMAKIALRIKATDQLNGSIDTLNGRVRSILPDWDAATGQWIMRPTSSPAAVFRAICQGPANKRPLADARLDLEELQVWAEEAAGRGLEFNGVFDTKGTVYERLRDVCAAGRAAFAMRDGRYSVARDRIQSVPVQHFTPRNSWGYRGRKVFVDLPHALRIRFTSEEGGYQQDERIVLDDGYTLKGRDAFDVLRPDLPAATKFDTLELFGCTSGEQAWRQGRYFLAVAKLRPETHEISCDIEHLVCTRGDLILLTHDVPLFGLQFGRVARLITDSDNNLVGLVLDEQTTMVTGEQYSIRVRLDDGTSFLRAVATVEGISNQITLSGPVSATDPRPKAGDLFMFGRTGQETRELIVKAIEHDADLAARITLVDHAPAVHSADLGEIPPFDPGISLPPEYANRPETPVIESIRSDDYVMIRGADGTLQPRMVIQLRRPAGVRPLATMAQVALRARTATGGESSGPFVTRPLVPIEGQLVSISDVEEGVTYQIRLRTITPAGLASVWVDAEHTIVGKSGLPPDVDSFSVSALSDGTRRYAWTIDEPPPDLAGVRIRYGESWMVWGQMASLDSDPLPTSPVERNEPPEGSWKFAIKAVDTSGNESAHALYVLVTLGPPRLEGAAFQDDQGLAGWPGPKTDCHVAGGILEADDRATWDTLASAFSAPTWDTFPRWNMGPKSPIVYESLPLDAGFPFAFSPDAIAAGEGTLVVEVSTSLDGITYADWEEISAARGTIVQARYLKSRVTCSANATYPIPVISRLLVIMRATPIIHEHQDLDTVGLDAAHRLAVGDIRLPIPAGRFAIIRSVLLGFNNSGPGYTWELIDRDVAVGPRVKLYNEADLPSDAVIDAVIRGYGSIDGSVAAPPIESIDYRLITEAVDTSLDYDLITAGVTDTEDYGSVL